LRVFGELVVQAVVFGLELLVLAYEFRVDCWSGLEGSA
jgi:hypothetical protein